MLIECPFCHARAKLPDSKEGAKVRCGECGRVYVAREGVGRSAAARKKPVNTGLIIGISVGVVALIALLVVQSSSSKASSTNAQEPPVVDLPDREERREEDLEGWDSAPVKVARAIHEAAWAKETMKISGNLSPRRFWEARREEGAEDALQYESWNAISSTQRSGLLSAAADRMMTGEERDLIADWQPFDGTIVSQEGDEAVVHVRVSPRAGVEAESTASRTIQWNLVRENDRWKAYSWERFLTASEQKPKFGGGLRGMEKVELEDGSVVLERQPEPLGHLADTPSEVRTKIDELYAKMIDLDLTREASEARRGIISIGKPAIPILLTGLYEIPLDTREHSIQINSIDQALQQITGQDFGYKPQEAVGSGTGTSAERRESAIRQWFAWWYRNENKFEQKVTEDALEALGVELTEKDKDWLRRHGEKDL